MSCGTKSRSPSPYLYVAPFRAERTPAWVVRVFAAADRALQRRRQRNALLELSDRQLKDIGVTREQAQKEGHKPFWR
jgi:uncharacterized protein YjiS (DUF1127 family)